MGSRIDGQVRPTYPQPGGQPAAQPQTAGAQPAVQPAAQPQGVPQTSTVQISDGVQATSSAVDPPVQTTFPDLGPTGSAQPTVALDQPRSIPPEVQTRFNDFSKKLNSNPNVNYIEIDRRDVNKGLREHLTQFKTQLDANPELKAKLAQTEVGREFLKAMENAANGKLGSVDIINIQAFVSASGIDLSHAGSASGIDGDYGPLTHEGLSQVMSRLQDPAQTEALTQALTTGDTVARQRATARQTEDEGFGNTFDPERSRGIEPPTGPVPSVASTGTGADIVNAANATRGQMAQILERRTREAGRPVYRCYEGVKLALNNLNPPMSLTGGSAYMAADQLRSQYADRFQDIRSVDPHDPQQLAQLRNLPPGAILVWGRNDDPGLRSRNPNNGFSHGHISISMGGGMEYSDRMRNQSMNRDGRYDTLTIFIPK